MRLSLPILLFLSIVINTNIVNDAKAVYHNTEKYISFGQENLSIMLEISGGLNGKISLNDFGGWHEELMLLALTQFVPNQAIVTSEEIIPTPWSWESYADQLKRHSVRVIHRPTSGHVHGSVHAQENMSQVIKDTDVLIVHGTGNIGIFPHDDIFQPEDPFWGFTDAPVSPDKEYHQMKAFFERGHVIMASYASKKPATFEEFANLIPRTVIDDMGGIEILKKMYQNADTYVRHPRVLRFGDMKEYGFTVELPEHDPRLYFNEPNSPLPHTPSASFASAHLSVFAFYLFQLWDTTAEVVEVMQKTAIDIGEPGPDEEFGWGLINADHPIIWDKAIERLQQSLGFCLLEDVSFEEAITIGKEGFDLFHDIRNDKREIGLTYGNGKTTVAATTGSALSPFGLESRFLRQQQRNTLTQFGLSHSFIKNVSFLGIFGYSSNADVKVHKGSVGISYQTNLSDTGNLSLYAGYRSIWGSLGLPGYKVIGTGQVPFALYIPEIRASFGWSF